MAAAEKPPPVPEVLYKLPVSVEERQPDAGLESTRSGRNGSAKPDSPGMPGTDKAKDPRAVPAGCWVFRNKERGSPENEATTPVSGQPSRKFLNE